METNKKILTSIICLLIAGINVNAQMICTTPAPAPPAWLLSPVPAYNITYASFLRSACFCSHCTE